MHLLLEVTRNHLSRWTIRGRIMPPPEPDDVSRGQDVLDSTTPATPEVDLPTPEIKEPPVTHPDIGADLYSRVFLALDPDDIEKRCQQAQDWLEEIVKAV